jgi:hypothetical protein
MGDGGITYKVLRYHVQPCVTTGAHEGGTKQSTLEKGAIAPPKAGGHERPFFICKLTDYGCDLMIFCNAFILPFGNGLLTIHTYSYNYTKQN